MVISPTLIKAAIVLALVVGTVAAGKAYRAHVYDEGYNAAVALRAKQDADKKLADTEQARIDETALAEAKRLEQLDRKQKEQDRETYIVNLESRVRSGAVSLSIATAAIRAGSAGGDTGPVAGPAEAERTNLLPEDSVAFIRVAADSARDVRDYNALMVEYERAQAMCNKGSRPK